MSQIQPRSVFSLSRRLSAGALLATATAALLQAQVPGRNVNMVSGTTLPHGDPYVQRQDEPTAAASTRNPLHLLAGANDYRTVDLPGLEKNKETGDAWMGVFKSNDGGNTWRSTLIPGYPQDPNKFATPLHPYEAAADPVVRAGTNGLFFYSGIVFVRDTVVNGTTVKGKSAMFVSRFIDNNNLEAGDPIVFLDTKLIATNPGTAFIDKPWFAVDRPRAGAQTCTINTTQPNPRDPLQPITTEQIFPGGAAYAAYSMITGEGAETRSQIYLSRSLDCGANWSAPQQVSSSNDPINQGATLAIDPTSGVLYLAWRRFSADGTDDSIMVTRSMDQGRRWDPPGRARRFPRGQKKGLDPELHGKKFKQPLELTQLASFDQPTAPNHFRTNAYPTMTVDGSGRVYVAWSERGFAPNNDLDEGDARILVATSTNGAAWSNPILVDNTPIAGHQIMPSMSFAGGKLMLAYYDFQHDVSGVFTQVRRRNPRGFDRAQAPHRGREGGDGLARAHADVRSVGARVRVPDGQPARYWPAARRAAPVQPPEPEVVPAGISAVLRGLHRSRAFAVLCSNGRRWMGVQHGPIQFPPVPRRVDGQPRRRTAIRRRLDQILSARRRRRRREFL